ncbi:Riboflavin synthase-like protein [Quillaja saponaria]|uniref:Riboflavin synthase-like protein n=1 Tax=Quillaja saponaria TaxID=32244 RepID=A0AAD7QH89_QUISA|nr:Riboflavin synthase-like protein [Quillaja saponaria]
MSSRTNVNFYPIFKPSSLNSFLTTYKPMGHRCRAIRFFFTGIVEEMGTIKQLGDVDGTGEIVSMDSEGDSLWVQMKAEKEVLEYVVPKGLFLWMELA